MIKLLVFNIQINDGQDYDVDIPTIYSLSPTMVGEFLRAGIVYDYSLTFECAVVLDTIEISAKPVKYFYSVELHDYLAQKLGSMRCVKCHVRPVYPSSWLIPIFEEQLPDDIDDQVLDYLRNYLPIDFIY